MPLEARAHRPCSRPPPEKRRTACPKTPSPSSVPAQGDRVALTLHRDLEARAWARVAVCVSARFCSITRSIGGRISSVDRLVALGVQRQPARDARLLQLAERDVELRTDHDRPEREDARRGLESERAAPRRSGRGPIDPVASAIDERLNNLPGKGRHLQQRENRASGVRSSWRRPR